MGRKNIILIGLMGSGKTTLGVLLAQALGYRFIDSDQEIEQVSQRSICTWFEQSGEEAFRLVESAAIARIVHNMHDKKKVLAVLATGGGAILAEKNRCYLKQYGFVIYLHSLPHLLYLRLENQIEQRPLLALQKSGVECEKSTDDPPRMRNALGIDKHTVHKSIAQLYQARDILYRETADLIIDCLSTPQHSLMQILSALKKEK